MAEDNELNQRIITLQLEKLGYTVELTSDGAQALAAWQHSRHPMLLTDCDMPVMDGNSLAREIRKAECAMQDGPRTTIIAVTANAVVGETEACLRAGMDDFLAKPLDFRKLEQTLKKWNAQAAQARGVTTTT